MKKIVIIIISFLFVAIFLILLSRNFLEKIIPDPNIPVYTPSSGTPVDSTIPIPESNYIGGKG